RDGRTQPLQRGLAEAIRGTHHSYVVASDVESASQTFLELPSFGEVDGQSEVEPLLLGRSAPIAVVVFRADKQDGQRQRCGRGPGWPIVFPRLDPALVVPLNVEAAGELQIELPPRRLTPEQFAKAAEGQRDFFPLSGSR